MHDACLYTICNTDLNRLFRRIYTGGLHVSDTVSPRGVEGLGGGGFIMQIQQPLTSCSLNYVQGSDPTLWPVVF